MRLQEGVAKALRAAGLGLVVGLGAACAADAPTARPVLEAVLDGDASRRVAVVGVHAGLVQVLVWDGPGMAWTHLKTTSSPFGRSAGDALDVVIGGERQRLDVVGVSATAPAPRSAVAAKRALQEAVGPGGACPDDDPSPACAFERSQRDCSGRVAYLDLLVADGLSVTQVVDGYVLHWANLAGGLDAALPGRCVFAAASPAQQATVANRLRQHAFDAGLDPSNRIHAIDALEALERARGGAPTPSWLLDLATADTGVVGGYARGRVALMAP